jgi:phage-related protein
MQGVMLPRRQIIANNCSFTFPPTNKHPECPYAGALTTCDKTLDGQNGCKVHFPEVSVSIEVSYPFGGFPGATIAGR